MSGVHLYTWHCAAQREANVLPTYCVSFVPCFRAEPAAASHFRGSRKATMAATGKIACLNATKIVFARWAIPRPFPKGWQVRIMLHKLGPGLRRLKVPRRRTEGCETVNPKQPIPNVCLQNHCRNAIGCYLESAAHMTASQADLLQCQSSII